MTAVWYDEDSDRIWIEGASQSYAPRTLVAVRTDDMVGIRLKERTDHILWQPFGDITDGAGLGFLSAAEAEAYLAEVFARRPAAAAGPRGPGMLAGEGAPADDTGLKGDLYLDALTGDLYSKET